MNGNAGYIARLIRQHKDMWYSEYRQRYVRVISWDIVDELADYVTGGPADHKEFVQVCEDTELHYY